MPTLDILNKVQMDADTDRCLLSHNSPPGKMPTNRYYHLDALGGWLHRRTRRIRTCCAALVFMVVLASLSPFSSLYVGGRVRAAWFFDTRRRGWTLRHKYSIRHRYTPHVKRACREDRQRHGRDRDCRGDHRPHDGDVHVRLLNETIDGSWARARQRVVDTKTPSFQ